MASLDRRDPHRRVPKNRPIHGVLIVELVETEGCRRWATTVQKWRHGWRIAVMGRREHRVEADAQLCDVLRLAVLRRWFQLLQGMCPRGRGTVGGQLDKGGRGAAGGAGARVGARPGANAAVQE
ncbi:hypothetical protein CYMTET_5553 [Cymbomonas tetramitiformis]|uniref:Uncharacterized protein n=1 Tax=Cymbomonas tetramitiformis TaxID=36881 RepID=A0AAE0LIY2_9CHLO|nr:hypothetical protein CYMTET_5553 [Cymbomonas tetramitiformis]